MSLSAVIVDDEQLARDELAYLLKNVDDVNVVAQGKNGLEAVNLIKEHNPDLVFLDLQMPVMGGFEVVRNLKGGRLPVIVEFHGGPAGSSVLSWDPFGRFFTSLGYAYLEPDGS